MINKKMVGNVRKSYCIVCGKAFIKNSKAIKRRRNLHGIRPATSVTCSPKCSLEKRKLDDIKVRTIQTIRTNSRAKK